MTRQVTRTASLRQALERGAALTRLEACERFGITGSTFRWVIKSMRDQGIEFEVELVSGTRGSTIKRWSVRPESATYLATANNDAPS